jgi:hypothetical protein
VQFLFSQLISSQPQAVDSFQTAMSLVIKVTESFIVPSSTSPEQLAAVIIEASQCPFELRYKGRQANVLQVSLVGQVDGEVETQEEAETPKPPKPDEPEACEARDKPAAEQPEETPQQRGPKPPDYPPPVGMKRDSQSSWEGWQQADWQQEEWHQGWQHRGGAACHVCGLVRADHPGKKFCDVKAKRVRL